MRLHKLFSQSFEQLSDEFNTIAIDLEFDQISPQRLSRIRKRHQQFFDKLDKFLEKEIIKRLELIDETTNNVSEVS